MRPLWIVMVLLGACTVAGGESTTTTASPSPETTGSPESTTPPNPALPDVEPPCLTGDQEFVSAGGAGVIEREDSDADTLSAIRWDSYEGCDRVVFEFATRDGAPAISPPGVGPLFIRSAGVLRLQLDAEVTGTTLIDQVIDAGLTSHAYVVRRPSEDLFVDLHLADPAEVRVGVASGPARVIVDIRLGGGPYEAPAIVSAGLVVVDPVGGSPIYPFTVNGYVLQGQDPMEVVIATGQDEQVFSGEVGSTRDGWGAFTVLVPDGPDGPASLVVGGRVPIGVDLS